MNTFSNPLEKNKKIAIICNSSNIDFLKYFKSLVKYLDHSQIYFLANKTIANELNSTNQNIKTSSYVRNSFLDIYSIIDFSIALFLIIKLKWQKVKLIHFITAHSSNIPQAIFARFFGIKVAFTIHDLIPHPDKKTIFINMYNDFVIKYLSNYIVVHNKIYLNSIKKKNVEYIPLSGFEKEFINRKLNNQLLFFGRIEPYKGIENLFKLGTEFLKHKIDYKIVITGKGHINYEGNEVPSNVEIINRFISDKELKNLHEKSAFTILPYNSASQSGVIIHSYTFATPVIAYDVGALSEYIIQNNTGILVEHNDFNAVIEFLTGMTEAKYQNMQEAVIAEFEEKYDSECFANYSAKLYHKILKEKRE